MRREMHSTEYGFTWKLKINKNKPRNLFENRVSLVLFCFEQGHFRNTLLIYKDLKKVMTDLVLCVFVC